MMQTRPQSNPSVVHRAEPEPTPAGALTELRRSEIEPGLKANRLLANRFENAVTSYTINQATGMIVSEGTEYANTNRCRSFVRVAESIRSSLPPVAEGYERLWRGNRPGEIGSNPSFTNSLAGIALPFLQSYKGQLSYVDVPRADLDRYLCRGVSASNSEFMLSPELAARAVAFNGGPYRPSLPAVELYSRYLEQGGIPEVGAAMVWLVKLGLALPEEGSVLRI